VINSLENLNRLIARAFEVVHLTTLRITGARTNVYSFFSLLFEAK